MEIVPVQKFRSDSEAPARLSAGSRELLNSLKGSESSAADPIGVFFRYFIVSSNNCAFPS